VGLHSPCATCNVQSNSAKQKKGAKTKRKRHLWPAGWSHWSCHARDYLAQSLPKRTIFAQCEGVVDLSKLGPSLAKREMSTSTWFLQNCRCGLCALLVAGAAPLARVAWATLAPSRELGGSQRDGRRAARVPFPSFFFFGCMPLTRSSRFRSQETAEKHVATQVCRERPVRKRVCADTWKKQPAGGFVIWPSPTLK
jgi:hypothetical protein